MANLLSELELYLHEVLQRPPADPSSFYKHPAHDINPALVAQRLGVTTNRASALLNMCLKAGLIIPRFDVYCPETKDYISSYYPPEPLPEFIECSYHDFETVHHKDECLIWVMFEFARPIVSNQLRVAV